jgi:hypothetical protein
VARHRRPQHLFRAVGVFVLVLGAVAGVYLGLGRGNDAPATAQADPMAVSSALPDVDVTEEKAAIVAHAKLVAQQKAAQAAAEEAERVRRAEEAAERQRQAAASRSQERSNYPVPASCNEYSGNRAIGCALLLEAGFGLDQMPCLEKLWTKESGWNELSQNRSSGAYGIPQALPGSKMAVYGEDWQTNPVPQIKWGLNYISNRYGDPCGAWSFFQSKNWY